MITTFSLKEPSPQLINPSTAHSEPGFVWYDLENPTPEECENICTQLNLPQEHVRAALDINERPRLEHSPDMLLIVMRTPVMREDGQGRISFATCPVALIHTPQAIVTVCLEPQLIQGLLRRKMAGTGSHMSQRLLLSLLLRFDGVFIEHLRMMDDHLDYLERSLQKSLQNKELLGFLHVEKSLIYFLTALKGNQGVLERMKTNGLPSRDTEVLSLFDDVCIEHRQAMDMAEIFTQIIGSLNDVFGGMVSNNLNKVMKVLTSLTMLFMIPSVIGALYGMNVHLPGAEHPHAFAVLCILCAVLCFVAYRILRRMDWM